MCVAIPALITGIDGNRATVSVAGVVKAASLMMLPGAEVGDYVLLHAGFAVERLDEQEALRTLAMFREIADAMEAEG
jgi:hydrogenase expression/formation protein HypC